MATTSQGTKEPAGAATAGKLAPSEVVDDADTSPRVGADLKGKRVRAIPGAGGTTVVVRKVDFKNNGIDHPEVKFDFRKDRFTLAVGDKEGQLSQEAADFLTENYPVQFEYLESDN
jgi:hypothetical protein